PSYVTSAEERLLKKKKNTKRTRRLQLLNIIQLKEESLEDSDLLPPFRVIGDINIPLSSSGSYPTMCFMIEQRGQLEHRIQSRQYTWHSIALGVSLICELFRLGSSYRSIPPSHSNDIEVTVTLNESLKAGEPNSSINEDYVHLHERTNPVLRINVSSHFSSRVGLKEQLLETIGSSKDYIPQKTPPPMTTLFSLKQVFANPWCHRGKEEGLRDESCGSRIDQTLERMEKLNLDPRGDQYGPLSACIRIPWTQTRKDIIVDLQEMVTRCSKTRLDFKIAPFGL
ncbi:Vitamin D3 receptorlike, partial [Caligus rogercresseyi]